MPIFLAGMLAVCFIGGFPAASSSPTASTAQMEKPPPKTFPLDMDQLMASLTNVHESSSTGDNYPVTVSYPYIRYDILNDKLDQSEKTVVIEHKPERIIPHSVGISEILWAIAPHERIVAWHESCLSHRYSFLADKLRGSTNLYRGEDAEIVIAHKPDLVLTTYYSSEEFKHRLVTASVPLVELGFFGGVPSIEKQILLIGQLTGENQNAVKLVETMESAIQMIQADAAKHSSDQTLRVLFYGEMGYVAGSHTNFDSICKLLGVVNIPAAEGLNFFKQIDYETLLKWNPDAIIVATESHLAEQLYAQPMLKTAKAIKGRRVKEMPSAYLMASSQYVVASVNYLAGLLYER